MLDNADARKLKLFALSIAWRTSVGENKPKQEFKLEKDTERQMRLMLRKGESNQVFNRFRTEVAVVSDSNLMPYEEIDGKYKGSIIGWPKLYREQRATGITMIIVRLAFRIHLGSAGKTRITELKKGRKGKGIPLSLLSYDDTVGLHLRVNNK